MFVSAEACYLVRRFGHGTMAARERLIAASGRGAWTGRPSARDSQRSGPAGAVTSPSARLPRHRVAAVSGAGAPTHVPEAAHDRAGATVPRKRRDRPTHRGRRSYVRKRGPRRHRRDWTDAAGPRAQAVCAEYTVTQAEIRRTP